MQRLNLSTECDPLVFFGFPAAIILMLTGHGNSLHQFPFHAPHVISITLPWSCWTGINPPTQQLQLPLHFQTNQRTLLSSRNHLLALIEHSKLCLQDCHGINNHSKTGKENVHPNTTWQRLQTATSNHCHRNPTIACPRGSSQQRDNDRPCLDPARGNSTGGSTNLELLRIEFQMALNYFTGCDEKYAWKLSTTRWWRYGINRHWWDGRVWLLMTRFEPLSVFICFVQVARWFLIDFSLVSHWFPSAPSPPVLDRALSYISVPDHECHHHKCTARCDRSFEVLEWGWALEFGHARGKLQHCQGCEEVAQFGYLTEPSNRFLNWSPEAGKRVALKKARNTLSNGSTEQCFDCKLLLICGLKSTPQNQSSESFPTWYSWFNKHCRGQELCPQSWTYWNAGKTWTNPKKVCPGMLAL